MPRKAYIADLKELTKDSSIPGVSKVRPGDDDGEFKFGLTLEDGGSVDISALILPSKYSKHEEKC
jgi:ubiquitin-conjugating enzyme E2 Q